VFQKSMLMDSSVSWLKIQSNLFDSIWPATMLMALHSLLMAQVLATTDENFCVGEWCRAVNHIHVGCQLQPNDYFLVQSRMDCQNECILNATCVLVDWVPAGSFEGGHCGLGVRSQTSGCNGTEIWFYLPTIPMANDFAPSSLQLENEFDHVSATECRAKLVQQYFSEPLVAKWSNSGVTQTIIQVWPWPRPQGVSVKIAYVPDGANAQPWYLNGETTGHTDVDLHMAKTGKAFTATLSGFFFGSGHCMAMHDRNGHPKVHAMQNDKNSFQNPLCSVGVSPKKKGSKGAWVMQKPNSEHYLCLQKPVFDPTKPDGPIPVFNQVSQDDEGTNCDQNWHLEVAGSYNPVPGVDAVPEGTCQLYSKIDGPSLENSAIHAAVCEGLEGDWNIPYYFTGPVVWAGSIHLSGTSGTVDMGVPGLVYHFAVSGSLCKIHFCVTPNVQPGSVACTEPGNFLSGRLNSVGDIIWDQDNYPRWTRKSPPSPTDCPNMPFYACVKDGKDGTQGPFNCAQAPEKSMCTAVMADGTPPFCRKGDNCKWCDATDGSLQCNLLDDAGIVV